MENRVGVYSFRGFQLPIAEKVWQKESIGPVWQEHREAGRIVSVDLQAVSRVDGNQGWLITFKAQFYFS